MSGSRCIQGVSTPFLSGLILSLVNEKGEPHGNTRVTASSLRELQTLKCAYAWIQPLYRRRPIPWLPDNRRWNLICAQPSTAKRWWSGA